MAESKKSSNEDNGKDSTVSGSEFVFEHICQPCSEEKVLEAIGFCIDCQEWLCEECYKCHKRPTPMRNHQLIDMEQMRTNMPSATGKDRCTKTCEQHEGKKLKYFCSKHGSFGCSICIFQNHKGCSMDSIQELAKDIFNKSEFTSLMDRFKDIISTTKAIKVEVNKYTAQTTKKHSEAIESIKTFKKELIDTLDEIENDLENKCSLHKESDIKKLKLIDEKCETVQTQSHTITSQIESLKERGQNCDTFVAMKQAATEIKPLEDTVKEVRGSKTWSQNYTFKPNTDVLQTLRRPGAIGTLTADVEYDERHYSNLKAEHVKDISLGDNLRITGSALLTSNKLVLVANSEQWVKVISTNEDRLISETKVDNQPWSVAVINEETFAVTVYNKNTILILRLLASGKLSEEKSIKVSGQCLGIAYYNETFIVTFQSPDKIEMMDMTGSVLQTFATSSIATPQHVFLSPDKQSVYVSNLDNNTVLCLRLDGTLVAKYQDDELVCPEQAAVDKNGMVFVSAFSSNNVHLITPNCEKVKVILSEADGLKHVFSISYCAHRRRLYIGMANSDKIKVFQLK